MRTTAILLICALRCALAADTPEKAQRKALEAQVKTMTTEAGVLEKSGKLVEARGKYAESQALIEMKDATESIKRLDQEIKKRVKDSLREAHKLYDLRKFTEAAARLEEGMKLKAYQSVLTFNLALCHYQLADRTKALEYLRRAWTGTADPKEKEKLAQLSTIFTTGEGSSIKDTDKNRVARVNRLAAGIGLEASLDDEGGAEAAFADASSPEPVPAASLRTDRSVAAPGAVSAGPRSSLCSALAELKDTLATSPAAVFNLANCSESNGRTAEAAALLEKYLELAPQALDEEGARARIANLRLLLALPGQSGLEVRLLYSAAYGALSERKFQAAMTAFQKADSLAPDFALTKWMLALLHEAMGNIEPARENFTRYQQLSQDQSAKDEAGIHLSTLDAKRAKYDEEMDAAGDIVADLFNRAMNLTFNLDQNRSALRAKRAQVKKSDQAKAKGRVGGFAVPHAWAQQQLAKTSDHLQIALALFPLGAEANELMGLVFLQANDGRSAIRSFDTVASLGLPVVFYAELRTRKLDRAVKVELSADHVRLIFLSSYDKNGKAAPPAKPAGEDGLGDMLLERNTQRAAQFDSLEVTLNEIKKVETDKGMLKLKLTKQDIWLAPIYLPAVTPIEGPQARRFANNYTRLFVRYPGLENSKLGAEGMTGGEKFALGYKIATAATDIAMSGFTPISAISSVQDAISIARTIRGAMSSLSVSFATWQKGVEDQQRLLAGKGFKSIPVQPANLAFAQDVK